MSVLRRVEIRGYRSIRDVALDLGQLNILIGANGAGKSNFVSFFKLLNEMMNSRLQQYLATTGRSASVLHFGSRVTREMEGVLEFQAGGETSRYSARWTHAAGDTLIFAEERLRLRRDAEPEKEVTLGTGHLESQIYVTAMWEQEPAAEVFRHLLEQCRAYHFHDTSSAARVRQYGYVGDDRALRADAGNLAAILFAYKKSEVIAYRRIVSTIRKVMPEFDDFDLEPSRSNPNEIALNWRKKSFDYLFGPHQISDGSLRAMALCTLLLQPERDRADLIVLDEPELGLHPFALEVVAGLVRAASVKTQIIAATQSQSFLDFFEPDEIITAEVHGGESRFRRLDSAALATWLEDYTLGELWQRNVLGAGPLP